MKEITLKLRKEAIKKYSPLVEQLAKEGLNKNQIVKIVETYIQGYIKKYYQRLSYLQPLGKSFGVVLDELKEKSDSKAEVVLYHILNDHRINFKFQYSIGKYRADFLIEEDLIVELDGPLHSKSKDEIRDRYLKKMGYKILRIPIWVISMSPEAVIEEIKEIICKKESTRTTKRK